MTAHELARHLRCMYEGAPPGCKNMMLVLFGIRFADEIRDCQDKGSILELADIGRGAWPEINVGRKLAEYVVPNERD